MHFHVLGSHHVKFDDDDFNSFWGIACEAQTFFSGKRQMERVTFSLSSCIWYWWRVDEFCTCDFSSNSSANDKLPTMWLIIDWLILCVTVPCTPHRQRPLAVKKWNHKPLHVLTLAAPFIWWQVAQSGPRALPNEQSSSTSGSLIPEGQIKDSTWIWH